MAKQLSLKKLLFLLCAYVPLYPYNIPYVNFGVFDKIELTHCK